MTLISTETPSMTGLINTSEAMSTIPVTIKPRPEAAETLRSSNGHAPDSPRPPAHSEPPREKRFFRILRVADMVIGVGALLGGFLATTIDRMPAGTQEFLEIRFTLKNLLLVLGFAGVWRLICILAGLYDERRTASRKLEAIRVLGAVTAASSVALIFPLISVTQAFSHRAVLFCWIGGTAGMLLFRSALRALLTPSRHKIQDILIVGSGPRALSLYYSLFAARTNGFRLLGFVDSTDGEVAPEVRSRLLGDLNGLEQLLMRQAVDEVLIALPVRSRYAEIQHTIEICERGGV